MLISGNAAGLTPSFGQKRAERFGTLLHARAYDQSTVAAAANCDSDVRSKLVIDFFLDSAGRD